MKKIMILFAVLLSLVSVVYAAPGDVSQEPIANIAPISAVHSNGTDITASVNGSDGTEISITNTSFNVTWNYTGSHDYAYLVLEAYEGGPAPETFYIQRWDGNSWINLTSCGYSNNANDIRLFDLSGNMPDANDEYKLRILHNSVAPGIAKVDYVGLNVSDTALNPKCGAQLATDFTLSENLTCEANSGLFLLNNVELDCDNNWIIGPGPSNAYHGVLTAYAEGGSTQNTVIKNCNIKHFDCGVYLYGSHNRIIDNIFVDDYSADDGCIGVSGAICSDSDTNSTITGNTVREGRCYGMYFQSSTSSLIQDNIIADIEQDNRGYGFFLTEGSDSNNLLENNIQRSGSRGLYLDNSDNNNISGNKIYNNSEYGIYISGSTGTNVWHNSIYDNDGAGSGKEIYSDVAIDLSYNQKGNYWGHSSCPYYNTTAEANAANVIDQYPYGTDHYGSIWPTAPAMCVLDSTEEVIPIVGGVATPGPGNNSANYLANITGLNGTNVTLGVSATGDLSGNIFFYLNITGTINETIGQATITFKLHNSTINAWGASLDRIFVYSDHGAGFGSAEGPLTHIGSDAPYELFTYTTTEFSVFAPSYVAPSNPSSSGGGGGGSSSKTYSITIKEEGTEKLMKTGDKVRFEHGGEKHTVRLKGISASYVTVEVASTPTRYDINIGETLNVDLDEDGADDLAVYAKEQLSGSRARLVFSVPEEEPETTEKQEEPEPEEPETTETQEESEEETDMKETVTSEKQDIEEVVKESSYAWLWTLGIILVGGLAVFYIFQKKR